MKANKQQRILDFLHSLNTEELMFVKEQSSEMIYHKDINIDVNDLDSLYQGCLKILDKLPEYEHFDECIFDIFKKLDMLGEYQRGEKIYFEDLIRYIIYENEESKEIRLECMQIVYNMIKQGITCMNYNW